MDAPEIAHKLRMIATLTDGELRGWVAQMRRPDARPAFDGERAAIAQRAKALGISLGVSQ